MTNLLSLPCSHRSCRKNLWRLEHCICNGDAVSLRGPELLYIHGGGPRHCNLPPHSPPPPTPTHATCRFYQLGPDEEALVEAVLARGDDDELNPFDVSFALAEEEEGAAAGGDLSTLDVGGAARADGYGAATAAGSDGYGASSSGSGRPASALSHGEANRPVLTLAAINARLDRYAMEHEWTADGALADFGAVLPPPHAQPLSLLQAQAPSESPAMAMLPPPPPPAAARSVISASSTTTASGQRDYLREARQAKELVDRYFGGGGEGRGGEGGILTYAEVQWECGRHEHPLTPLLVKEPLSPCSGIRTFRKLNSD